jgi:hypothetical protein
LTVATAASTLHTMHLRRAVAPFVAVALLAVACGTPQRADAPPPPLDDPLQPVAPAFPGRRPTMAEASTHFTAGGVQPGQPLPRLSLLDLDGARADVRALQAARPLVLVTASLTCNVARRNQAELAQLQQRHGDALATATVYTIDAHPQGDPSPYSGEEWVPPANDRDSVLVRQPATLGARLELARRYAREWSPRTPVLVDTMDNASWRALGEAPNAAVVVDADGNVVARCGWFDPQQNGDAVQRLLERR